MFRACWRILIAVFGLFAHCHIAPSSANCDKSIGKDSSASYRVFMIKLNRMADSTAPCGDPLRQPLRSDRTVPNFTWILRPVKKSWIQSSMFPSMPNWTNFCRTPFLHMRSKAFSRSKNTAQQDLLRSRAVLMADVNRKIWSIVDLFLAHLSRRLKVRYCDHSPSVVVVVVVRLSVRPSVRSQSLINISS